jgi:mRNA interferase MazF
LDEGSLVTLERGTVVLVELDPTQGHEQRGVRPCIAVSDPAVNADQRFPLIAVVPVTATPGEGALYPAMAPGPSGLAKASYALTDHVRSIDKRRVRRIFGRLPADELARIDQGLELFLGLNQCPS